MHAVVYQYLIVDLKCKKTLNIFQLFSVQFFSVQCSVLSVQCSVFSVQCSEFSVQSSVICPIKRLLKISLCGQTHNNLKDKILL